MLQNLYLTLPDDISIGKFKNKSKLSLKIYFYLFYLFRFFIFKESLFFFRSILYFLFDYKNYLKNYIKFNIIKFKGYCSKIYLLYLFNKYNKPLNKIIIFRNISIIDLFIYYRYSIINKKINIYNNKFIYKLNKISIILFKEFILKIPFVIFIGFKSYIYKFRIYKYNEYLLKISNLINYSLLKIILRFDLKKKNIFINQNIFFSFKIYFEKLSFNFNKYKYKNLLNYNLINKSKFFKFFTIYKKKNFFFIYNYLKIYFLNIFFLYLYNIWILKLYIKYDWNETYKWNIFYLFHLYWWLYKYNFDLPIWLYILIIIQIIKIYLNNLYNKLNIYNLLKIKYKNNKNMELIFIKINSIILLTHFEKLYFKFFKLLKSKPLKFSKIKWKKSWNLIIKHYPLDFLYLPLSYYNNYLFMNSFIKKYIFNFDKIHWKIFYTGNLNHFTRDLKLSINANKLYNYLNLEYKFICIYLITYNKKKENLLVNFLFFYYMLRDLFFKIIFKKHYLNNYSINLNMKYYFRKKLNLKLRNWYKINFLLKLKKNQNQIFSFFYDKYICFIILIIFVKKYTK